MLNQLFSTKYTHKARAIDVTFNSELVEINPIQSQLSINLVHLKDSFTKLNNPLYFHLVAPYGQKVVLTIHFSRPQRLIELYYENDNL